MFRLLSFVTSVCAMGAHEKAIFEGQNVLRPLQYSERLAKEAKVYCHDDTEVKLQNVDVIQSGEQDPSGVIGQLKQVNAEYKVTGIASCRTDPFTWRTVIVYAESVDSTPKLRPKKMKTQPELPTPMIKFVARPRKETQNNGLIKIARPNLGETRNLKGSIKRMSTIKTSREMRLSILVLMGIVVCILCACGNFNKKIHPA